MTTFIDMCFEVFDRVAKTRVLSKDAKNYNRVLFYRDHFFSVPRREIEEFIIYVRMNNPFAALTALVSEEGLRKLSFNDLYRELQWEIPNLILKGTYESIKLLNDLDEGQSHTLFKRMTNDDFTIFIEYLTGLGRI